MSRARENGVQPARFSLFSLAPFCWLCWINTKHNSRTGPSYNMWASHELSVVRSGDQGRVVTRNPRHWERTRFINAQNPQGQSIAPEPLPQPSPNVILLWYNVHQCCSISREPSPSPMISSVAQEPLCSFIVKEPFSHVSFWSTRKHTSFCRKSTFSSGISRVKQILSPTRFSVTPDPLYVL